LATSPQTEVFEVETGLTFGSSGTVDFTITAVDIGSIGSPDEITLYGETILEEVDGEVSWSGNIVQVELNTDVSCDTEIFLSGLYSHLGDPGHTWFATVTIPGGDNFSGDVTPEGDSGPLVLGDDVITCVSTLPGPITNGCGQVVTVTTSGTICP